MTVSYFIELAKKLEIQIYDSPKSIDELKKTHISFCGCPKLHPVDTHTVILLADPFGSTGTYYEFKKESISFIEEMPSIATPEGDVLNVVRIWVKKGNIGILCTPFLVEHAKSISI